MASPDVPSLVTSILLDPARPIPVIVISTEGYDAPPGSRVDPDAVARRVAGLAIVILLSDKYASWSLTDSLSKELSCYLGAIRVYWPGLTKTSNPLEQPLYLPLTIARIQGEGTPFHDLLFQRLANTASARYVEGPVFRAVREASRRDQDVRRNQLLDELRGSKASAAERSQQVTELEQVIRQRDEEIAYLRDENANLQRNWLDYSKSVARSESSDSTPVPIEESAINSVADALSRGERDFSERLVVWRSARESAGGSRSRLGSRVYEALSAMSDVADQSFRAKAEKRSMGMDLGKAFRMRGFDYSARESETAMGGKLGAQRRFRNGPAEEMTMERHLTIGGGDTENCVRIHFEIDDANNKFIIGWCGRHPDVPSTRT
jgi:hypothetical protein